MLAFTRLFRSPTLLLLSCVALASRDLLAETEPASEPAVTATARAMPAVVNIATERTIHRSYNDPMDQVYEQFFGRQGRSPRQVAQKVQSLGSGFLVDPDGYILTNEHVVERAADLKIQVTTTDGKTYDAKYVAGDAEADLALIKIDAARPLPFISLTDLSPNLLAETVLVLGNPLGYGSSVSRGILSARDRTITVDDLEYKGLVQTDAAINPGNSGGPVIDLNSKLVGVSSVKMAYTPQGVPTQGIGFAIAGEKVRDVVAQLRKQGSRPEGLAAAPSSLYFGMAVQDLTPELTDALNYAPGSGVLVSSVEKGSPAAREGIRRGLVIYSLGDYEIRSTDDLNQLLAKVRTGDKVDFGVGVITRRGGLYARNVQTVSLRAR